MGGRQADVPQWTERRSGRQRRGDEMRGMCVCVVVVLMLRARSSSSTAREGGHWRLIATICWKEDEKLQSCANKTKTALHLPLLQLQQSDFRCFTCTASAATSLSKTKFPFLWIILSLTFCRDYSFCVKF